jgi:SAM-dependent methyltransferase
VVGAEPADGARQGGGGLSDAAAVWGGAAYERIAEAFAPVHDRVVAALAPRAGERALDIACGTGALAIRMARAGAEVVGVDIAPGQLEKARAASHAAGLGIRFDEGDAQALPYPDATFEVAASTFGIVFTPDHARAAAELARVCTDRFAVTSWPFDDWSELAAKAGRPLPPGDDARLWSREDYVRRLLGDAFELRFERGEAVIAAGSADELWELIATSMPPLKAWLDSLEGEERARGEAVYRDFVGSSSELRREYVLVLGSRR